MIGGIYCSCTVGGVYVPSVIDAVQYYCSSIFGKELNKLYPKELDEMIVVSLLRCATYAMKYVSAKGGRGFKNDSMDLLKSMGVAVYDKRGYLAAFQQYSASKASNEQSSSSVKGGLLGSLGISEFKPPRDRSYHPDPHERFMDFIKMSVVSSNSFRGKGYSVAFVATMPYAVRLEHKKVAGFGGPERHDHGGFGKRVLIGNINSVVNAFYRKWGDESNRDVKYGYIFESTGQSEEVKI